MQTLRETRWADAPHPQDQGHRSRMAPRRISACLHRGWGLQTGASCPATPCTPTPFSGSDKTQSHPESVTLPLHLSHPTASRPVTSPLTRRLGRPCPDPSASVPLQSTSPRQHCAPAPPPPQHPATSPSAPEVSSPTEPPSPAPPGPRLPSPKGTHHTTPPAVYPLAHEHQGPGLWGPWVPFRQEPPTPGRACHGRPPTDTQHTAPGEPVGGKGPCSHQPFAAPQAPQRPPAGAHLSCRPSFLKRKPMVRRLKVGGVERTQAR